jgi:hypothetical protein
MVLIPAQRSCCLSLLVRFVIMPLRPPNTHSRRRCVLPPPPLSTLLPPRSSAAHTTHHNDDDSTSSIVLIGLQHNTTCPSLRQQLIRCVGATRPSNGGGAGWLRLRSFSGLFGSGSRIIESHEYTRNVGFQTSGILGLPSGRVPSKFGRAHAGISYVNCTQIHVPEPKRARISPSTPQTSFPRLFHNSRRPSTPIVDPRHLPNEQPKQPNYQP